MSGLPGDLIPVPYEDFVSTYHGHEPRHLEQVVRILKAQHNPTSRSIIYFAGDSSLDNKYWFAPGARRPACNGYERAIDPPFVRPDVCWAVNRQCVDAGVPFVCVNSAVEATTLASRRHGLREQDAFIRDHITAEDVLIVSIGGNDIALMPSPSTIASIGSLVKLASVEAIDNGTAMGYGHFITMFKDHVTDYILKMTAKTKPRLVIVCMIYYPHEQAGGSWADSVLGMLGYNSHPTRLQKVIRKVYEMATAQIRIPGTTVVPCGLFDVLDASKGSTDFLQRVEPSESGGVKMASAFLQIIKDRYDAEETKQAQQQGAAAVAGQGGVCGDGLCVVS